ncbi:MAG: hypothetical protein R3C28_17050 [Pirellulaceae bacterium]
MSEFAVLSQQEEIQRLLQHAHRVDSERRSEGRTSLLQPVIVKPQTDQHSLTAFSRDVSSSGIGLLHQFPLPPQSVTIYTNLEESEICQIDVEIQWCLPCSEGWYISGGRFRTE